VPCTRKCLAIQQHVIVVNRVVISKYQPITEKDYSKREYFIVETGNLP